MRRTQERLSLTMTILPTALSLGLGLRFSWAVFSPAVPKTIDWTPAIYGTAGFLAAAFALQHSVVNTSKLPSGARALLLTVNGALFGGYILLLTWLFSDVLG